MTAHSETRISKGHQVVVPSRLRKKHGLSPGDVLVWKDAGEVIEVIPRKRVTRRDITGMVSFEGDAVEIKRRVQRGGK